LKSNQQCIRKLSLRAVEIRGWRLLRVELRRADLHPKREKVTVGVGEVNIRTLDAKNKERYHETESVGTWYNVRSMSVRHQLKSEVMRDLAPFPMRKVQLSESPIFGVLGIGNGFRNIHLSSHLELLSCISD
jgi:hypothetical protein